jgi:hypothetical protein
MGKAQSFLRQQRVQEVLGRVSSLAEQPHLRETMHKVPPLDGRPAGGEPWRG